VKDAIEEALGRFPAGIYAVWYPLLQRMESRQFADRLKRLPAKEWLNVTLTVSTPGPDGFGLHSSGMFILNPPYTLEAMLRDSSSFLDRLEEVGMVAHVDARRFSLVGPIARGCGLARDLRKAQPYSGYEAFQFDVPSESEGDGYARLRVLFAEARQSLRIMNQAAAAIPPGAARAAPADISGGGALGWVEAPRGASFHWLRVAEGGTVERYRIVTPSFINWRGFHFAVEKFAFQDFPIILASFGLSPAENDR